MTPIRFRMVLAVIVLGSALACDCRERISGSANPTPLTRGVKQRVYIELAEPFFSDRAPQEVVLDVLPGKAGESLTWVKGEARDPEQLNGVVFDDSRRVSFDVLIDDSMIGDHVVISIRKGDMQTCEGSGSLITVPVTSAP